MPQFSSVAQSCLTLCDPMDCSMPGLPVHHQLPEFTHTHAIESVMPSNHLMLCCPLLLPSVSPSLRVFSNELAKEFRQTLRHDLLSSIWNAASGRWSTDRYLSWSGRSPGEGHGNPLQYSCLENPMDRGAQQVTVHVVAKSGHD